MAGPARPGQHLGITVMPEYVQNEGIEAVLDRFEKLGVTTVTTMPSVAAEVPEGQGSREPPIDGGAGGVRVLDRPLWGKHALHIVTAPSFAPNRSLYSGLVYQPPEPTALTDREGPLVGRFIAAAKSRGMTVFLQVMAAIPPCFRVQFGGPRDTDRPMLPGAVPLGKRVDNNASLAAADLRAYVRVMVADLLAAYPEVDGIRFDWPEYPPYHPLSLLADYNPQVRPYAEAAGIDFERLERAMLALTARLPDIWTFPSATTSFATTLDRLIEIEPALADHLALRRLLVADHARHLRTAVAAAGGGRHKVFLQGFPPPWNTLSGFDLPAMAAQSDLIGIKFYTMHWPMMLRSYVEYIAAQGGGDRDALARSIQAMFVPGGQPVAGFEGLAYPEPDVPHGVGAGVVAAKLADAARRAPDLIAITHGYGPIEDVTGRFVAAWRATNGRVEINRYGYLSDAKIDALAAARQRLQ